MKMKWTYQGRMPRLDPLPIRTSVYIMNDETDDLAITKLDALMFLMPARGRDL